MTMVAAHLPGKIRTRRLELNLSQREAAAQVGVSERTWQNWEAGDSFPRPSHRRALDKFFNGAEAAA